LPIFKYLDISLESAEVVSRASHSAASREYPRLRKIAVTREDAPIDTMLRLAHIDLDAGRLDLARVLYDRVLKREPQNAEAIAHQGGVLYGEGRVDEALAKVEAALRIDPTYVHAHWDRVQYLYHGKRDLPGAIKAGEAFLKIVPDGPDADTIRKLMAEARGR